MRRNKIVEYQQKDKPRSQHNQKPSSIHMKQKTEKETNKDRILQSIINTFIPHKHNGRGV